MKPASAAPAVLRGTASRRIELSLRMIDVLGYIEFAWVVSETEKVIKVE